MREKRNELHESPSQLWNRLTCSNLENQIPPGQDHVVDGGQIAAKLNHYQKSEADEVIDTSRWRQIHQEALVRPEPMVIHTVTFPPGSDPSRYNLSSCIIKDEQRTRYPAGTIPETEIERCPIFNVYVQPDPAAISNSKRRYIVVNKGQNEVERSNTHIVFN